jgi:hypothetical protein
MTATLTGMTLADCKNALQEEKDDMTDNFHLCAKDDESDVCEGVNFIQSFPFYIVAIVI